MIKTNPEKCDFSEVQFSEGILKVEQYLNDEVTLKVYRKFHILLRFHL